jgi:selenocysteine lyase/cysteine desulfurase
LGSWVRIRPSSPALSKTKYNIYTSLMAHEEYTGIRITPSIYTTVQEIDYFADAVEKELKSL